MKLRHLWTFIWLNWRLRVNQLRRSGILSQVILALLVVALAAGAVGAFVGSFSIAFALDRVPPIVFLFIWDGLVLVFLFFWSIGLLTDLQRSEGLSLTKFLHLPVSLSGVFVLNYLSSLISVSLILMGPAMFGLTLGLILVKGPALLLALPLLAAFVLAVTALTYQFQGWLASLMVDKRRRRTIIVFVTAAFILIFQVPNLINVFRPWETMDADQQQVDAEEKALRSKLDLEVAEKKITLADHQKQLADHRRANQEKEKAARESLWQNVQQIAWIVNVAVPIGWLPLGVMGLVEGQWLPALLGTLGLGLIGMASLWRAYRTTLRLYTGDYTSGVKTQPPAALRVEARAVDAPARPTLIARQLPFLSEPASAIALAGFQSILRAPEAKMLLLTPIILVFVFAGAMWRTSVEIPELVRPLMAFGAVATVLLTLVQFLGNQFGFDRAGFRVYVLSPAPRRDILFGKNLAVMPIGVVLCSPLILMVAVVHPMRVDHLVAVVPLFVSMYLSYCLLANLLSIYAPMAIAAGSMKPAKTQWGPILVQMMLMWLFPVVLAPSLLPLGIEALVGLIEWTQGLPIFLVLSLLECVAVVYVYRLVLTWQGGLLQGREQRILEIVTSKVE